MKRFTDFELAASGGILALVADLAWLTKDILHNGFHYWYMVVGTGLFVGIVITGVGWYKHYKNKIKPRGKHTRHYYHKYDDDWD